MRDNGEISWVKLSFLPIVFAILAVAFTIGIEYFSDDSFPIATNLTKAIINGLAMLGIPALAIFAIIAVTLLPGKYPPRENPYLWILIAAGLFCSTLTVGAVVLLGLHDLLAVAALAAIREIEKIPSYEYFLAISLASALSITLFLYIYYMRQALKVVKSKNRQ